MMLLQQLVRILGEVEELRFADGAVQHVEFHELPIALLHRAHTWFCAAAIRAIDDVADCLALSFQHGAKAEALAGRGCSNTGKIAKGSEHIEQVDVSLYARAGFDSGAARNERHSPRVLVKML